MAGGRVQVIERSLDLLEALSEGPRSLSAVCRTTGLSKATAFRLLAGLNHRGVVIKDPATATYMLGPGLLRLVHGAMTGLAAIAALGRAEIERLALVTGETVALHVQAGLERSCVDEVPSTQTIRYTSSVGSVARLDVGSAGQVLLAFMPAEERGRSLALLEGRLREEGADPARLRRQIAAVGRQGWATSLGERVKGAAAISVPVGSRPLLLALSVLGPDTRLDKASLKAMLPEMQRTAAALAGLIDRTTDWEDKADERGG
jgi:DNA-binding IclR family transcriptional regulator